MNPWRQAAMVTLGLGLMTGVAGAQGAFPSGGVAEALQAHLGKPVTVVLTSGTELGGTVAGVRDGAVVLKGLTGKEFYDALVVLAHVAAVQVRARER